jgi:hypothetical protein
MRTLRILLNSSMSMDESTMAVVPVATGEVVVDTDEFPD